METSNYALLCRMDDHYGAALLKSTLAESGIEVIATGGETLAAYGDGPGPGDPIELWVQRASLKEALRAIADGRTRPELASASAWTCATCSESNDAHFELCWNCRVAAPDNRAERA